MESNRESVPFVRLVPVAVRVTKLYPLGFRVGADPVKLRERERVRGLLRYWRRLLFSPESLFTFEPYEDVYGDQELIHLSAGEQTMLYVGMYQGPGRLVGLTCEGNVSGVYVQDFQIGGGAGLLLYSDWVELSGVCGAANYLDGGVLRDRPILIGPNRAEIMVKAERDVTFRLSLLVERLSPEELEKRGLYGKIVMGDGWVHQVEAPEPRPKRARRLRKPKDPSDVVIE